eukprot:TRINITY_DN99239_c0_g1_i1.p1 TRINITY_DN99239_c0_g1~~TRINITY_DN99239_c0_g1_i1.p1  ORF type:complete len:402 (+),score=72.93 TRINITY_DN99239_c0_g1_i1:61-1206(+)
MSRLNRAKIQSPKLDLRCQREKVEYIALLDDKGLDVEAVLGSGTVACVKRVRRRSDGAVFAAKCMSSDPEIVEVAREELRLLSRFSFPHILKAEAFFEGSCESCLLTEYCGGGDLEKYVRHQRGLEDSTVHSMMEQLLEAVNHLHCKRVVHRDIKPANIFLHAECNVLKLGDFNSAKLVGKGQNCMLSRRCSPDFAAPELLLGQNWNERVDIWSVGLCIYFMKRQCLPFQSGSARIQSLFLQLQLPDISWTDIPHSLSSVVEECLAVDMRIRPPAIELLEHPAVRPRCSSYERVSRSWTAPDLESSVDSEVEDNDAASSTSSMSMSAAEDCPVRHSRSLGNDGLSRIKKASAFQQLAAEKFARNPKDRKQEEGGQRIIVAL